MLAASKTVELAVGFSWGHRRWRTSLLGRVWNLARWHLAIEMRRLPPGPLQLRIVVSLSGFNWRASNAQAAVEGGHTLSLSGLRRDRFS